ncbi:MAG: bis(5'-nucleosyl)-tetraphosphatase (symmetrical) YqeK [Raoultibacter sp.]
MPDAFFEQAKGRLKQRLDQKRFEHSLSVSQMAVELARAYGVDERKARLAGLLHDWDKNYTDEEIQRRSQELGVSMHPVVLDSMPRLLHGPSASLALKQEFPELGPDILQAIARHTSAEIGMTDLDMIVYTADAIEPLRPFDDMVAIRESIGIVSLESLFLATFQHVLSFLIEKKRRMHPDTVDVWNYYVERSRNAKKKRNAESKEGSS